MNPPANGREQLREEIVERLELATFPVGGYEREDYLRQVLAAGFDVREMARAHAVSKKSIYRVLEAHDIEPVSPPRNGLARTLWEADPEAIPTEQA